MITRFSTVSTKESRLEKARARPRVMGLIISGRLVRMAAATRCRTSSVASGYRRLSRW